MTKTTILLAPAPRAKGEFLAIVEPLTESGYGELPSELTIDSYTREPWSRATAEEGWNCMWLKSVDGKGKTAGFVRFLKERQKSAYGMFESKGNKNCTRALFVVPFDPPHSRQDNVLYCKYCLDTRKIPGILARQKPPPLPPQLIQQLRLSFRRWIEQKEKVTTYKKELLEEVQGGAKHKNNGSPTEENASAFTYKKQCSSKLADSENFQTPRSAPDWKEVNCDETFEGHCERRSPPISLYSDSETDDSQTFLPTTPQKSSKCRKKSNQRCQLPPSRLPKKKIKHRLLPKPQKKKNVSCTPPTKAENFHSPISKFFSKSVPRAAGENFPPGQPSFSILLSQEETNKRCDLRVDEEKEFPEEKDSPARQSSFTVPQSQERTSRRCTLRPDEIENLHTSKIWTSFRLAKGSIQSDPLGMGLVAQCLVCKNETFVDLQAKYLVGKPKDPVLLVERGNYIRTKEGYFSLRGSTSQWINEPRSNNKNEPNVEFRMGYLQEGTVPVLTWKILVDIQIDEELLVYYDPHLRDRTKSYDVLNAINT